MKIIYRLQRINFGYWQDIGDFDSEEQAKKAQKERNFMERRSRILVLKYD